MMRQITHPGAPFPTIDAALDAAEMFVRQEPSASFVGAAAEEQHGGYFVRVAWSTPSAGSRHRRNHRHQHVAEIGRIAAHDRVGTEEGDLCRRGGCQGSIQIGPVENCSCHISPPCNACLDATRRCSKCRWESGDE